MSKVEHTFGILQYWSNSALISSQQYNCCDVTYASLKLRRIDYGSEEESQKVIHASEKVRNYGPTPRRTTLRDSPIGSYVWHRPAAESQLCGRNNHTRRNEQADRRSCATTELSMTTPGHSTPLVELQKAVICGNAETHTKRNDWKNLLFDVTGVGAPYWGTSSTL
jgi:hypothetical protein